MSYSDLLNMDYLDLLTTLSYCSYVHLDEEHETLFGYMKDTVSVYAKRHPVTGECWIFLGSFIVGENCPREELLEKINAYYGAEA